MCYSALLFERTLNGKELKFDIEDGQIVNEQTESVWTITGEAIEGPYEGEKLETVTFGDYFAWLVFWPDTEIYKPK